MMLSLSDDDSEEPKEVDWALKAHTGGSSMEHTPNTTRREEEEGTALEDSSRDGAEVMPAVRLQSIGIDQKNDGLWEAREGPAQQQTAPAPAHERGGSSSRDIPSTGARGKQNEAPAHIQISSDEDDHAAKVAASEVRARGKTGAKPRRKTCLLREAPAREGKRQKTAAASAIGGGAPPTHGNAAAGASYGRTGSWRRAAALPIALVSESRGAQPSSHTPPPSTSHSSEPRRSDPAPEGGARGSHAPSWSAGALHAGSSAEHAAPSVAEVRPPSSTSRIPLRGAKGDAPRAQLLSESGQPPSAGAASDHVAAILAKRKEIRLHQPTVPLPSSSGKRSDDPQRQLFQEMLQWSSLLTTDPDARDEVYESPPTPQVTFSSLEEYQKFMGPMLLMELREGIKQELHQRRLDVFGVEVTKATEMNDMPIGDGYKCWHVKMLLDRKEASLQKLDIVELEVHRCGKHLKKASAEARALVGVGICLAVLDFREWGDRSVSALVAVPTHPVSDRASIAAVGTEATIRKITNCVTEMREWKALYGLHGMSQAIREELLTTKRSNELLPPAYLITDAQWDKRARHIERLRIQRHLDPDQLTAVENMAKTVHLKGQGFSLVQGPPGTGKSTLLLALLNVLHNAANQDYYDQVLQVSMSQALASSASHNVQRAQGGRVDLLAQLTHQIGQTAALGQPNFTTNARKGRILVCAHSNAAVDELLCRMLKPEHGFIDEYGGSYCPIVIRIGSNSSTEIAMCTVDHQCNALFDRTLDGVHRSAKPQQAWEYRKQEISRIVERTSMQKQQKALERRRAMDDCEKASHPEQRRQAQQSVDEYAKEIIQLNEFGEHHQRCLDAMSKLGMPRHDGADSKLTRAERDAFEMLVLTQAQIVFCTTSAAADRRLQVAGEFETIVFDEAAQAGELATLIPLQFARAGLAVLVGDPQQLPATVLSLEAKRRGFSRSLFERLQQGGRESQMLHTQYRMHPAIRAFPSCHFYRSSLRDGPSVTKAATTSPGNIGGPPAFLAHSTIPELRVAPYVFFNLKGSKHESSSSSHSLHNT
mmetsp:Transcript_23792/g.57349  ORF Transcript_23792/g.57349 Transcript_23792/m.57349 type:complete len:1048 (-) Transcript_23792:1026-4169(-)